MLSVVMPVHNAMPHLDDAVRSILDQTYPHFEFVILDDGSTDGSLERLREWAGQDDRIKLFENASNSGPVASSNKVVELSSGSLVARMDADDICHPERLARQVRLMRERRDVGMVATGFYLVDADGRRIRGGDAWRLHRKSWFAPFAHGAAMFRRDLFDEVGGYRPECEFWEDQDLFVRMLVLAGAKILIFTDPLYGGRHSRVGTRLSSKQQRVEQGVDLMYRSIDRLNQGLWYDDVLRRRNGADGLDPRVFIALGSLELWARGRPRLFARFLKRARMTTPFAWLSGCVWTLWANLSPSTLRVFMMTLVQLRNLTAAHHESAELVEWLPPRRLRATPVIDRKAAVSVVNGVAG